MTVNLIGAKRGGVQEQCSQKLFGLAEIISKIIKFFKNYRYIWRTMKKNTYMKLQSKKNCPYSKYFLVYLAFLLILRLQKIDVLTEIFWKHHLTTLPKLSAPMVNLMKFLRVQLTLLNFRWRRWGSLLLGLRTLDHPHRPPLTPVKSYPAERRKEERREIMPLIVDQLCGTN